MSTSEQRVRELCTQLLDELPPRETDPATFLGRQYDLGLAWVHFPVGYGGLGVESGLQAVVNQTLWAQGAPNAMARNFLGIGMGGATVLTHGTEEQKQRLLRPLFMGEELWCQLFSEPGAGSDLAALATRAVQEGDQWIVNGQKVWTTYGHLAKWGMLLTRTDPDIPKHAGMTYFIIDMHAPGVDVRPLVQMTGEAEFNEVYMTDVVIPDSMRIGGVGQGWNVAMTTLSNERIAIGGQSPPRGGGHIANALNVWRDRGYDDPILADQLTTLWADQEALRLTNIRATQKRAIGAPGPESSVGKVVSAELRKRVGEFVMQLLGPEAQLMPGGYPMTRVEGVRPHTYQYEFLRSRANSIEGGTTEISKNIIAERMLGMPGEIRVDKDVAWKDVPRS